MFNRFWLVATTLVILSAGSLSAQTTHYVAPIGANTSGAPDGTAANPWSSVGEAISSGKVFGGDTLLLKDGNHGSLHIYNRQFEPALTIRSENNRNAHFDWVRFYDDTSGFVLDSVSVWPVHTLPPNGAALYSQSSASNIVVQNTIIRGAEDSQSFMDWTLARWNSLATSGINFKSSNSSVLGNVISGVQFGISTSGHDVIVDGNTVDGFGGDGLRGLGDRSVFRRNRVSNCFSINSNHDDGFQSWQTDGSVDDLTLDGNTFIEWTGPADHPLRCMLQGIGLFDGWYENLTITNNIVAVTHWHGISVYGGHGVNISNNTVVNLSGNPADRPWILVHDHKNGEPTTGVTVANNLTMKLSTSAASSPFTTHIDNSIIFYPASSFKDVLNFDYTPTPESGFIDTANATYAPDTDVFGRLRPFGLGPDKGAIEVGAPDPVVEEAQVAPETSITDSTEGSTSTFWGTTSTDTTTAETSTATIFTSDTNLEQDVSGEGTKNIRVGRWLKAPKGRNK